MKLLATPKSILIPLLAAVSISSIIGFDDNGREETGRFPGIDSKESGTNNANDIRLLNGFNSTGGFDARIVGGDQAKAGDYPYFVLGDGCGAALVAPDVILFAAHCKENSFLNKQVSIGAYKFWESNGGAEGRFCEKLISHPKYSQNPSNYDYALCKLDRPVESFNKGNIQIELNFDGNSPNDGEDLIVMGFGTLESGGSVPEYLRDVTVDYISTSFCNNAYRGRISDAMMCAGIKNKGGKDACQGDSGGPLIQRKVNRDGTIIDTHVGVTSWGIGCASEKYPGVYARTSNQALWIKNIICDSFQSVASYCNNPVPKCDKAEVTINVETDNYPGETSWTITDSRKRILKQRQNYKMKNTPSETKLCLDTNACYRFEINDSYGDGVCSSAQSCGSYSIMVNGKNEVTGNPSFGKSVSHVICTNSNTPPIIEDAKLTSAPTKKPTPNPTKEPTNAPTHAPTHKPTKEPTPGPTHMPTNAPTNEPTHAPTHTPTRAPTRKPSYTPTHVPTNAPAPRICEDKVSEIGFNCKKILRGSKERKLRRCNRYRKGYSVKNYWCRKTCATVSEYEDECFPYSDKRKTRNRTKKVNSMNNIVPTDVAKDGVDERERSRSSESRNNIFERSN